MALHDIFDRDGNSIAFVVKTCNEYMRDNYCSEYDPEKYDYLHGANFSGNNLENADLHGLDLFMADFRHANLKNADFRGAKLKEAKFYGANIEGVDFRGADLRLALTKKKIEGVALFDETTKFYEPEPR